MAIAMQRDSGPSYEGEYYFPSEGSPTRYSVPDDEDKDVVISSVLDNKELLSPESLIQLTGASGWSSPVEDTGEYLTLTFAGNTYRREKSRSRFTEGRFFVEKGSKGVLVRRNDTSKWHWEVWLLAKPEEEIELGAAKAINSAKASDRQVVRTKTPASKKNALPAVVIETINSSIRDKRAYLKFCDSHSMTGPQIDRTRVKVKELEDFLAQNGVQLEGTP